MFHSTRSPRHAKALFMLLIATFFWGISFPVIKALGLLQGQLMPGAGSWFSGFYTVAPRFVIAAVILLAWQARSFWKLTPAELKQGMIIGGFSTAGMLFQNDGLQFTAASTSAFLTQFYAIMIPVYLALRGRVNPGALVWTSCGCVLVGVAVLGHFNWHTLSLGRGEWETLLSSVFFMGQIIWLGKPQFAANRPEKITLVMFVTQAAVFSACLAFTAPDGHSLTVPWTSPAWLSLTAVLTIFSTVGAYFLMNMWQPHITATEAGLIYCIEPIFGSALALFLPGLFSRWAAISYSNELMTRNLLIGGGLITAANMLIQLKPPTRPAADRALT